MTEEIWKPIPGYEGYYEASSEGNVRSLDRVIIAAESPGVRRAVTRRYRGRLLKPSHDTYGYRTVTLHKGGKPKPVPVHQVVCAAFHGPRPDGMDLTRHLDGNHLNNTPANLAWGTYADNAQDALAHGVGPAARLARRTRCSFGHEYTPENTMYFPSQGDRKRFCRACMNRRNHDYQANLRAAREQARSC